MAGQYAVLKQSIQDVIKTNGNNEITGALMQQSLLAMITSLGAYYQFVDVATPSTNPGTPDQNVMYFAGTAGTYTNFGGIVVNDGEFCALCWNGSWIKKTTGAATAEQVTALGKVVNGEDVYTSVTGTYHNGLINSSNGVISGTNQTTYQYTDAIAITDDMQSLRIKGVLNNSVIGAIGFYKSSVLPVASTQAARTVEVLGAGTSTGSGNEEFIVSAAKLAELKANGALYFSVCVYATGDKSIEYLTHTAGIVDDIAELDARCDNIEASITTLEQSVNSRFEDTIVLEDEVTNYGLYTTTQVGKLYDSDGSLVDNIYYDSTALALLDKDHDIYPYIAANENRTYVVYFDKDKQFISRVQGFNFNSPALKSTFPVNAKYVAFSWVIGSLTSDQFATRNAYIRMMGWKIYCTFKKKKGTRPVVDILPTDSEGDILVKLCNAYIAGDCDVKFNFGEYSFQNIYADMVSTYEVGSVQGSWQRELPIGRNCVYDLCNSTITGSLPTGVTDAKVFGNMRTPGESYKMMNGKIVNNGMAYAIHDEGQEADGFYLHEYKNLEIVNNNGGLAGIGIGTGLEGVVNVDKCVFLGDDSTKPGIGAHGITDSSVTARAVFELNITNCWFFTFANATSLSPNQTAKFVVSGCSVKSLHTGSTWDKYFFCNEIRS